MKQPTSNYLDPSALQEHQDKHRQIFMSALILGAPTALLILWGAFKGIVPVWWPLYVPLLLALTYGAVFFRSRSLPEGYEMLIVVLAFANGVAINLIRLFGYDGPGIFAEYSLYLIMVGIFLFQSVRWATVTALTYAAVHLSVTAVIIGRDSSPERWIAFGTTIATVGLLSLLYLYRQWWEEAYESRRAYQRLAYTDDLTTLPNRRALQHFWQRYVPDESAAVMMVDIDHFKRVNDRFGHAEGDRLLWSVGQLIHRQLGVSPRSYAPQPVVGRWGGEEFLVLLPASTPTLAYLFAESIRESVEHADDATPLTVSLGVALREPGESLAQTAARADAALYQAKMMGRNRVVLYDELETPFIQMPGHDGSFEEEDLEKAALS